MSAIQVTNESLEKIMSDPETIVTSKPLDAVATSVESGSGDKLIARAGQIIGMAIKWLIPPVLGLTLFIGLWALVSQSSPQLPTPAKTWESAQTTIQRSVLQQGSQ